MFKHHVFSRTHAEENSKYTPKRRGVTPTKSRSFWFCLPSFKLIVSTANPCSRHVFVLVLAQLLVHLDPLGAHFLKHSHRTFLRRNSTLLKTTKRAVALKNRRRRLAQREERWDVSFGPRSAPSSSTHSCQTACLFPPPRSDP